MEHTAKENILTKIRQALLLRTPNPYPKLDFESDVYSTDGNLMEVTFAEQLKNVDGNFVYCESEKDFIKNFKALLDQKKWKQIFCAEKDIGAFLEKHEIHFHQNKNELKEVEAGITSCEFLVARTGTVLVSSRQTYGRTLSVYPPVHIVIAYVTQLVRNLNDAFERLRAKHKDLPSMISAITGPSRTADIEKTLVLGAHGPKELYVFLIDDSK